MARSACELFATSSMAKLSSAQRATRERKLKVRDEGRQQLIEFTNDHPDLVLPLEEQRRILQLRAVQLVKEIKQGKISAEQVMVCMCLLSKQAGEALAATTEEMFMQAIDQARAADVKLAKLGPSGCGPLHGLPISIKDHIDVEGVDSTAGIFARAFDPRPRNAALVQALVDAGAIPYVKSNVPLSLMLPESMNDLWGRALNPWNLDRTPGGSSGGEGSLVACGASFLGIGTDIGGSIRIPAHYCGLAGFKPTPMRVSSLGSSAPQHGRRNGQQLILGSPGPLARSVEDLEAVLAVWCQLGSAMYTQDPYLAPVPFRSLRPPTRVPSQRIGIIRSDTWFDVAPSCARALDEACEVLTSLGHELVEFEIPGGWDFVGLYLGAMSAEGGLLNMKSGLEGTPFLDEYRELERISKAPAWLRRSAAPILRSTGETRKAFGFEIARKRTVMEYFELTKDIEKYRMDFIEAMQAERLDAIVCPGGTLPALPHTVSKNLSVAQSLTYLFNLLHFPAGTVPISTVHEDEEISVTASKFSDDWQKKAEETLKNTRGLPLGIQIATKPFEDELCLEIMRQIDENVTLEKEYPFIIDSPFVSSLSSGTTPLEEGDTKALTSSSGSCQD